MQFLQKAPKETKILQRSGLQKFLRYLRLLLLRLVLGKPERKTFTKAAKVGQGKTDLQYIEVPAGVATFPKNLTYPPRELGERFLRVARWTEMPRGGHFATLEEPELYAKDVREFVRAL